MNRFALLLTLVLSIAGASVRAEQMNEMWGADVLKLDAKDATRGQLFRDGNYSMFIHWGLYSSLEGKWKEKTYYGIGEWIMNGNMAGIPVAEYMQIAKDFNPTGFDAKAIARLAKDAGMKCVVITSKHHEGFAMFKSSHPFNIVDATPFARDPMKELADACRAEGLGFGFYYSHWQDWTAPGGSGGPKTNPDGTPASFEQYFREKCVPQVTEICTNYGPLEIVWFDTPGGMPKEAVLELHELVKKLQPKAFMCSRIGHGLGDYASKGDMEVPAQNIEGLWETCDTTNDSWSFAWYDTNFKPPKVILSRLIATVARGGTYLLNVGPDAKGVVPDAAQRFLRSAGEWIRRHPDVVYGAGPSPWGRALPWGDVTMRGGDTLQLCVFEWPREGRLHLPGLKTAIVSAELVTETGVLPLKWLTQDGWTVFDVPAAAPDRLVSVIRVKLNGEPEVDGTLGVDPEIATALPALFARPEGCRLEHKQWMEKFGEWKHAERLTGWKEGAKASWTVLLPGPGDYLVSARHLSDGGKDARLTWRVEAEGGKLVQNNQPATPKAATVPLGILTFSEAGRKTISVSLVDGDPEAGKLVALELFPAR